MTLISSIILVIHIISVVIAVGSATVVDYLHLIGLRKRTLEKGLTKVYPNISNLINGSLVVIYLSGIFLVTQNIELLSSPLFLAKVGLVLIVTINGIFLQKMVSPHLDLCVIKGNKYCTTKLLYGSVVAGSISIVTWYSIFVLSLTKNLGYTLMQFLSAYILLLIFVMVVALTVEKNARKWR